MNKLLKDSDTRSTGSGFIRGFLRFYGILKLNHEFRFALAKSFECKIKSMIY
jgi:hypothetical protein